MTTACVSSDAVRRGADESTVVSRPRQLCGGAELQRDVGLSDIGKSGDRSAMREETTRRQQCKACACSSMLASCSVRPNAKALSCLRSCIFGLGIADAQYVWQSARVIAAYMLITWTSKLMLREVCSLQGQHLQFVLSGWS